MPFASNLRNNISVQIADSIGHPIHIFPYLGIDSKCLINTNIFYTAVVAPLTLGPKLFSNTNAFFTATIS